MSPYQSNVPYYPSVTVNEKRDLTSLRDLTICLAALKNGDNKWDTNIDSKDFVEEAKRRNLDALECRNIIVTRYNQKAAPEVGRTIFPATTPAPKMPIPQKVQVAKALASASSSVRLVQEGGTFKFPVLINGILHLHFIVDSGASDVIVPADVVLTLMRANTITPGDFLGDQTYKLADGSTVKSKIFRIRQLKVGDRIIQNVLGSITDVNGSLLLGQSFLSRFRRVSFDYSDATLILE